MRARTQQHETDVACGQFGLSGRGRGIHRTLTINSASNVVRYASSLAIAFFLTPYVVRVLGNDGYGIWVVALSFVGYANVLEFGVQPAVVKMVGQYRSTANWSKVEELVEAGLGFFAGVGFIGGAVILTVVTRVVSRQVNSAHFEVNFGILFAIVAFDVFICFIGYLFSGLLYGWHRYTTKNIIDIAACLANAAIVVVLLPHGGLLLLAGSKAVTDLLAVVGAVAACRHGIPMVRPRLRWPKGSACRELLSFGGKLFVSATANRVATATQPVIISFVESAAATAFYAIPVRLVGYSKEIIWALSTGFMPMFSELQGRSDVATIRKIYLSYSRYILLLFMPLIALLLVYGRSFIGLWIGPGYAREGGRVLTILTFGILMDGFQPLLWRLFMGIGRLNFLVGIRSSTSLGTIALSIVLIHPLGIEGVAYSALLMAVLTQGACYMYVSQYLELSPLRVFTEIQLSPLVVAGVYYVTVAGLARWLGETSYMGMIQGIALSSIAYAPMVWASLRRDERGAIYRVVHREVRRARERVVG